MWEFTAHHTLFPSTANCISCHTTRCFLVDKIITSWIIAQFGPQPSHNTCCKLHVANCKLLSTSLGVLSLYTWPSTNIPIYSVSRTNIAPYLYIWPVQITQSYGGDCLANTVDCLTLQILSAKTYNRRFLANPTDKYACQCSGAPRLWLKAPLHWLAYLSVGFARHRRLYRFRR